MPTVRLSGKSIELFKFSVITIDEFIPVVAFDRLAFVRPDKMRIVETESAVTLSSKIEESKRMINMFSFTVEPGLVTFKFKVEKGYGTWDDGGYIEPKMEPETASVEIVSDNKIKKKYGETFDVTLNITSHEERTFYINFYANDDEDDFNSGEYKNVHCGRIELIVAGSSAVGFRLISNIDALPVAPAEYDPPGWNTTDAKEITLSQQQANQYNNCEGVCYATSASRAQQAYFDIRGSGVVDLTVSNKNIDHRIASTQGGNDPFMGYGAGGPFARRSYGQTVDNAGVWSGKLKRGALLQVWNSSIMNQLYSNGGHSIVFRNYLYNDGGNITDFEYTDYHGGIRTFTGSYWKLPSDVTIFGVNLIDR